MASRATGPENHSFRRWKLAAAARKFRRFISLVAHYGSVWKPLRAEVAVLHGAGILRCDALVQIHPMSRHFVQEQKPLPNFRGPREDLAHGIAGDERAFLNPKIGRGEIKMSVDCVANGGQVTWSMP